MRTLAYDELIQKLNQFLKDENLEQISFVLNEIRREFKVDFQVVNISSYTHELLEQAKVDKVKFAKMQYFEKAASIRDLEYECAKYLGYKNQFHSAFPVFIKDDEEIQLLFTEKSEIIQRIESFIDNLPVRE